MTEEFIHFIWKFRMLSTDLLTTGGEALRIIHPGEHNSDSGPDFFNARIRIGDTLWAGNVEMHLRSSDWNRHGHDADQAYANTILHVVLDDDQVIRLPTGQPIPTLVIRDKYPPGILERYEAMMQSRQWIPCENLLSVIQVPDFSFWAPSLAVERMLDRSRRIREILKITNGNWEETLYQWMARGFGFRINAFPFELLARSLPFRILNRYRSNPLQIESLLFGQANLVDCEPLGDYQRRLRIEYAFLQSKHNLVPVPQGIWKFLRLRPSNFPTLRISQFGNLLSKRESLLPFILGCPGSKELEEWFDIRAAAFWDDHYTFGRLSPASEKKLGSASSRLLMINVVVPFLFYYGLEQDSDRFRDHAIHLLESLPPEDNLEIRNWRSTGMEVPDALRSQSLLQLKAGYCDQRRCISCRIGRTLLDPSTKIV